MMKTTPTAEQERWGAAAGLLSLDVVVPFYAHMGLAIPDPKEFVQVLRKCILENRRTFEKNPNRIPDLKNTLLATLRHEFDPRTAEAFEEWIIHEFVFLPYDFAPLWHWDYVLVLARWDSQWWDALGFPPDFSERARARLEADVIDHDGLHKLADRIDQRPLSDWDLEMYSLHQFDDDDNDPYNWILQTVRKRRFSAYFRWIVDSLSDAQLQDLLVNADLVRERMETTRGFPPLLDLRRLLGEARYDQPTT